MRLIVVAVVVALLAAAAVTAVIVLRSEPRAPGMLADPYPTAPTAAWVVDIETATGDPDVAFTSLSTTSIKVATPGFWSTTVHWSYG
ncbi:hypothetical protein NJ76_16130 [Rhodococcus sp. IITR03]|nr:hypothetical protein NJ76_16130 [Rhodococcus sp. IITR03]